MVENIMKAILIFVLFLFLSGCDTFYGVTRQANSIENIPSSDCVLQVMSDIENVKFIDYKKRKGSIPVKITGLKKPDINQYYSYEFDLLRVTFFFKEKYNSEKNFSQNYLNVNVRPSQEEIDKIRPIMIKIEKELEKKCNLEGLSEKVQEKCSGVLCKEIILN